MGTEVEDEERQNDCQNAVVEGVEEPARENRRRAYRVVRSVLGTVVRGGLWEVSADLPLKLNRLQAERAGNQPRGKSRLDD
jgi:hypothetical protein